MMKSPKGPDALVGAGRRDEGLRIGNSWLKSTSGRKRAGLAPPRRFWHGPCLMTLEPVRRSRAPAMDDLVMKPSVLQLSRQAGDVHIGQTLLRLASLAAAAHQHEALAAQRSSGRKDVDQFGGADPGAWIHPSRTDGAETGGTIHTEVDR